MTLQCEMRADCREPVTHIGEKGFIYCTQHAGCRTGWESCRRLRNWECKRLESGDALRSYQYQPQGARP